MSAPKLSFFALAVAALVGLARPAAAGEDNPITSADAAEAALPSPHRALFDLGLLARYDRLPGDVNAGRAGLTARALLGRRVGYCVGADLDIGASSEGLVYGAVAQLAGIGLRFGDGGYVSLCGGAGVGGASGVVPAALELPVELRARLQAGPLRLAGWVTGRFTAFDEARDDGTDLGGVDELEAGAAIGLGRQHTYWRGASAGAGPYLAFTFRELMGERVFAVSLGLELEGGN